MNEEKNLRDLLLAASKDPALKMEFLNNPEATAKKYNVALKKEHIEKIKKAAAFIDSLNDIRLPPGPIYYPIDPVLHSWTVTELRKIIVYPAMKQWIFYPAWFWSMINPQPLPPGPEIAARTAGVSE